LHRTYISDLERGARNPTITVVEKLAKALGVKPGALLD
jgi:transcriptional regulator with XRE-family HTH domain